MADRNDDTDDDLLQEVADVHDKDAEASVSVILAEVGAFLAYVGSRLNESRCIRMAAGLSYTSLLAIVPLTAIAFSVLAAFPAFEGVWETVQDTAFSNLLPQSAEAIRENFDQFVRNTASLSAVGVIALAATAILLLATVETDINVIFRVARPRALAPRLLVFWALLTLGPLLLGASFSMATYFFAATEWLGLESAGATGLFQTVLPTLMMIVLLTVFYIIIPNRPVGFTAGLIGGVLAALAFTLLRKGFAWYIVTFPTYQNIYGALSVIPIFLVWMYLSWLVVLIGAVLTASVSEWQSAGGKPFSHRIASNMRLIFAMQILAVLFKSTQDGTGAVHRTRILREIGGGGEAVDLILTQLRKAKYVARAGANRWLIARDIGTVTLYDLYTSLGLGFIATDAGVSDDAWRQRLSARLSELQSLDRQALSATLRDILDDHAQPTVREVPRAQGVDD